jgi:hypothetical protein
MENYEQNAPSSQEPKSNVTDEVKQFYKGDFKNIFISFFKNPIEGIYSLLEKPSEKAYSQSLILFASVFVLYLIGGYVIVGEAREYMEFSYFIKTSLAPVVFMFVISSLSFAIKSLSGKPNFKNELLTGGLCGIPLGLLIPLSLIIKILASEDSIMDLMIDPMGAGTIGVLLFFYLILMMINVFQQSLKSSGTKDAIAWYLSPASVLLALYITFQFVQNILL